MGFSKVQKGTFYRMLKLHENGLHKQQFNNLSNGKQDSYIENKGSAIDATIARCVFPQTISIITKKKLSSRQKVRKTHYTAFVKPIEKLV